MIKKLVFVFAILAVVLATAGTVPTGTNFKITLTQPCVVNGTELKAGEYRVTVGTEKVTILNGTKPIEIPAKIEVAEKKFDVTSIRYNTAGAKPVISEIRFGGSKTSVFFNQ